MSYNFRIRRLIQKFAMDKSINIDTDRILIEEFFDGLQHHIALLFDMATQSDELVTYPADWRQAFKEPSIIGRIVASSWLEETMHHSG